VDAARGRYVQAGLYPNPVLAITGDELADRQGPGGIWTAPQLTQEIVTGHKLSLSQAIAAKEVDRAVLELLGERYSLIGHVRIAYYELYFLQQRAEILQEVVRLADQTAELGRRNFEAKQISRLDVVQLEVEQERYRADAESVERELPAAFRRLAAVTGDPRLAARTLAAPSQTSPPEYELERVRDIVLGIHPAIQAARVGVDRAHFAVRRAEADPLPNITLTTGFVRQNQNRSNDWMIGVSVPLPLWNRNQGAIRTARAEYGAANQEISRVENELAALVATSYRTYASSLQRAQRYRTAILPRAEETYELSLKAFRGGQFEYLRVLQAQRALAEARLEYNKSQAEAWKAAAELSGFLLEEVWPPPPPRTAD
jgi:cobalt-zinc-cadmium efflux system outer membrane protein